MFLLLNSIIHKLLNYIKLLILKEKGETKCNFLCDIFESNVNRRPTLISFCTLCTSLCIFSRNKSRRAIFIWPYCFGETWSLPFSRLFLLIQRLHGRITWSLISALARNGCQSVAPSLTPTSETNFLKVCTRKFRFIHLL